MKYSIALLFCFIIFLTGCKSAQQQQLVDKPENWFNIALAEDVEIYTDTASIRHEGAIAYAREKRVYITEESRELYVQKIREEYIKMGKPDKAKKWDNFSYCIYNCLYECINKRFRILSVEDYDSSGKLIAKTTPSKNKIRWLNVDSETVGDYTFFFVCDYQE